MTPVVKLETSCSIDAQEVESLAQKIRLTSGASIITELAPPLHAARRVKKISPELRRKKVVIDRRISLYMQFFLRLREDSQFLRSTIQAAFALLCIWIGIEFSIFVRWGISGSQAAYASRPPGATYRVSAGADTLLGTALKPFLLCLLFCPLRTL